MCHCDEDVLVRRSNLSFASSQIATPGEYTPERTPGFAMTTVSAVCSFLVASLITGVEISE